jgi:hypothetical protein
MALGNFSSILLIFFTVIWKTFAAVVTKSINVHTSYVRVLEVISDPTSQDSAACLKKTLDINYEILKAVEDSS